MKTPRYVMNTNQAIKWIEGKTTNPQAMGCVYRASDADDIGAATIVTRIMGAAKARTDVPVGYKWVSLDTIKAKLAARASDNKQTGELQRILMILKMMMEQSSGAQRQNLQHMVNRMQQDGQASDYTKAVAEAGFNGMTAEQKQQVQREAEQTTQATEQTEQTEQTAEQTEQTEQTTQATEQTTQATDRVPGQHFNYGKLLKAAKARTFHHEPLNIFLVGPAGTGKTTAARRLAKDLGLAFGGVSALETKYELMGFTDAHGKYQTTEFRKIWEHGGVFLFDEASSSSSQALLAFNAPLANGIAFFPDAMIERHADCIIIMGDNVYCGATADYTERNTLDKSTLDRFVKLDWPIDEMMEASFSVNAQWLKVVRAFRAKIELQGIKDVLVTPRAVIKGDALIQAGLSMQDAAAMTLQQGLSDAEFAALINYQV